MSHQNPPKVIATRRRLINKLFDVYGNTEPGEEFDAIVDYLIEQDYLSDLAYDPDLGSAKASLHHGVVGARSGNVQ